MNYRCSHFPCYDTPHCEIHFEFPSYLCTWQTVYPCKYDNPDMSWRQHTLVFFCEYLSVYINVCLKDEDFIQCNRTTLYRDFPYSLPLWWPLCVCVWDVTYAWVCYSVVLSMSLSEEEPEIRLLLWLVFSRLCVSSELCSLNEPTDTHFSSSMYKHTHFHREKYGHVIFQSEDEAVWWKVTTVVFYIVWKGYHH